MRNDDSNEGHQSVPAPIPPMRPRHHTMAYSIVTPEEAKKRHGGSLAPTEEMEMVPPAPPALTVKNVIREIIEFNVEAWKKLPADVQELMISSPEKFKFYRGSKLPDIIFNGIRFHFESEGWCLHSVVEMK